MTNITLARRRLASQLLTRHPFDRAEDVVSWLGAVQSQDYAAARWALGLRLPNAKDAAIEQAFNAGAILRTHVMRPTWHFVSPADIRWLLALTAPRVHAGNASGYRKLELDPATHARCTDVLVKALEGGRQLTRPELASALQQVGIVVDDLLRLTYIVMHAELEGIICSGARRGKQFTYALLDERAPQAKTMERDAALATLMLRYFTGHGPATLQDFVWWSGLSMAEAQAGLALISSQLARETIGEQMYWFSPTSQTLSDGSPTKDGSLNAHLLPNFDEYTVGYKDRSAVIDAEHVQLFNRWGNVLNSVIVLDGQVIGTWKRTLKKDGVSIAPNLFVPLSADAADAVQAAIRQYGAFLAQLESI